MSSEPERRSSPEPRPGQRPAGGRRPDPARDGAAELARVLGYDPDNPATWPGNAPEIPAEPPAASGPVATATAEGPAEDFKLTDPKMMRALAHPVRMALLDLFAVHDTITATQASEALGESPANCAFHLRTLAKYGLVEEAGGGRGRERPWKATHVSMSVSSTALEGEQAKLAAKALGRAFVDRWLGTIRSVLSADTWPPEWEEAVIANHSLVFLTPDEAVRVNKEIRAILDRYTYRRENPALRPAGSLPAEYSVFAYPRRDLYDLLPAGQSPDADPDALDRPDDPDEPGPSATPDVAS